MDIVPSLYAILSSFATAVALALAMIGWRRRSVAGNIQFALMMLAASWWAFTSALEALDLNMITEILISKVAYLGKESLSVMFLLFALEYTRMTRAMNRRFLVLLWVIPLITVLLVFTNEQHGLIWSRIYPAVNATGEVFIYEHGAGFWIAAFYNYISIIVGAIILTRFALQSIRLYRSQAMALLLGMAISLLANILYVARLTPFPGYDLTPIAGTLTGVVFIFGVFRFRLLDLAPVARDLLVENMDEGVLVLDDEERVVDLNPAMKRLLIVQDAIIGQEAQAALPAWLAEVTLGSDNQQKEVGISVEGQALYLDVNSSVLRNQNDRAIGRLVVLRDITKRKQLEQLRDRLFDTIVHDLRNPLGNVLISLDMLKKSPDEAGQEDIVVIAQNSAEKMLRLVNAILDISRLEKGQIPLECAEVDLVELLNEALQVQKPQAQSKKIDLTIEHLSEPPLVYVDVDLILRVLQNLLGNALSFTPHYGQVHMAASYDALQGVILVSIADTGPGIPADLLPHLFQMFVAGRGGGSGVGLAFCRLAIEAHRGRIWAENRPRGGAIFYFTLPVSVSL